MSRYKTLLKDTFIFGLGSFGSKLILFLLVPLYTNFMTEAEYGTADLVFTIAQLLASFLSVVIFDAVIRFGLSKNEKKENVLLVGLTVLGFSVILGAVITPLFGFYKTVSPWKWYLYVYVLLFILHAIEFNYLKVKGQNKSYAWLSVISTALMALLNVYFLTNRRLGIQGYLLAHIISISLVDVAAFFVGKLAADLQRAVFDRDLLKRMVIFSAPLVLNNASWWVIQSSDKFMVEVMISTAALGIYTAAAKIPALINVVVSIFQQAWGISSVKEFESSNDSKYYADVFKYLFLFTSGACIVFVTVMKVFMRFYVGKGFQDAWHYVPLLLVSAVFAAVAAYFGTMYSALKKSVNNMLTTVFAAVLNIAVNWIFIPIAGIWGAVIGTVVSFLAVALARVLDVKRYLVIPVEWKTFLPNCMIILSHAVLVSLDYHIYICSAAAILAFGLLNGKDIKRMVVMLTKKLPRRKTTQP
ncbi:MAG: polysaccharide biosynthesis C-terminal domain-containing protein [Oscillospiraceae bacterium]|nr:polysaccharide biosynthesis C-terminal domain-containing protein [Oscillospiraceae bacterium]